MLKKNLNFQQLVGRKIKKKNTKTNDWNGMEFPFCMLQALRMKNVFKKIAGKYVLNCKKKSIHQVVN